MDNVVTQNSTHRHIVCWKSGFAGLAIALVSFVGLIGLSAAFGGIGLSDGTTWQRATVFTSACLVISTFVSIFAGAYYSVRIARHKVDLAGITQGALVGSLFLLLVFGQGVSAVGTMVKATGTAIGGAAAGAGAASANPAVQDVLEDAMGDLKLKSDAATVAKGLAARMLRGDQLSARDYLAYQASITPQQADQKIASVKAKADAVMIQAREVAATTLKGAGWAVFVLTVLGMMAAGIGGMVGASVNERFFLDMSHEEVLRAQSLSRNRAA
ncbi:MAG: hypothetical protein ACXWQJ_18890 [Bdellovibrionota bacterium]